MLMACALVLLSPSLLQLFCSTLPSSKLIYADISNKFCLLLVNIQLTEGRNVTMTFACQSGSALRVSAY